MIPEILQTTFFCAAITARSFFHCVTARRAASSLRAARKTFTSALPQWSRMNCVPGQRAASLAASANSLAAMQISKRMPKSPSSDIESRNGFSRHGPVPHLRMA